MPDRTFDDTLQADAARWVSRRHSGEWTAEDQRALSVWLGQDPARRRAYAEAEALWERLGGLETIAERQLREARAYLARGRARRRRVFIVSSLSLAASVMIALLLAPSWWAGLAVETHRTAVGERKTVALSDGSRIELNTDTELTVRFSAHAREVHLGHGEALFTVAYDHRKLFEVLAHDGRIRDTGTAFSVRAEGERVSVFVIEGRVRITTSGAADGRALKPGERLGYDAAGAFTETEKVDVEAATAWRDGRLVFKGRPLGEVIGELGRYHRATVLVTKPSLNAIKVSGVFPTGDLRLALNTIAATLPVRLTEVNPGLYLLEAAERE